MRYEAERAREQAQKQLAAAEGRAGVLHTRLDDVLADNHALKHKVSTLLPGSAGSAGSAGCCLQPVPNELSTVSYGVAASACYPLLHTRPPAGHIC